MSDLDVSIDIMALADDYANNLISFADYRAQRREILLQLEKDLNQVSFAKKDCDEGNTEKNSDSEDQSIESAASPVTCIPVE